MDAKDVRIKIEAALAGEDFDHAPDVAFHMTDWLDDLDDLIKLYQAPNKYDSDSVISIITKFLIHAPNHLAAASKLMLNIPVRDIFDVGATDEDKSDENTT